MKKVVYLLSSAVIALFAFTGCGDDDSSSEETNKVYNVKSITYTYSDGDFEKIVFNYENNKLSKATYTDYEGSMGWEKLTYASASSINVESEDETEAIITMDATNNVISKYESSLYNDDTYEWEKVITTYTFENGYLSSYKVIDEDNHPYNTLFNWENDNMISYDSDQIVYSDIKNNTNIDFALWMEEEDYTFTKQFINKISKNIPSSIKSGDAIGIIKTTLDEKGRPSKMIFDGITYTFEYYD